MSGGGRRRWGAGDERRMEAVAVEMKDLESDPRKAAIVAVFCEIWGIRKEGFSPRVYVFGLCIKITFLLYIVINFD